MVQKQNPGFTLNRDWFRAKLHPGRGKLISQPSDHLVRDNRGVEPEGS